ncbi:MAG TPA: TIGR03118 family protein [Candidatus Acidoferrum sp.]|nr:TIGR03118 family protein [Candidatus Acidoferrum sp.]
MHPSTRNLASVFVSALMLLVVLALVPIPAHADTAYAQTNLVSNSSGATTTDPSLVNPWGISASATSPFWVSDEGTSVATLYQGNGTQVALVVSIPSSDPTGQVFNSAGSSNFNSDAFLFATLSGDIDGWRGALGTNAEIEVLGQGASYTGLALANNGSDNYLYAANFASGAIDVFYKSFSRTLLPGGFLDPNLPAGYAPFNIQNINGKLYVEYVQVDSITHLPVPGTGIVDVFDANGNLLQRLATGGALNDPWGVTLASSNFGQYSNDLLIGNFGNGEINAYDPVTGAFLGTLEDVSGNPIVNSGLLALEFGNGYSNADPNALYFTAGTSLTGSGTGLFGDITATDKTTPAPEPGTLVMIGGGLLGLMGARRRNV